VDISCGSKRDGIYGGILVQQTCGDGGSGAAFVRTMRPGPNLTYEHWSERELALIRNVDGSEIVGGELELRRNDNAPIEQLWIGRRVGLKPTNEIDPRFVEAELRIASVMGHARNGPMRPMIL
jgi:hypothetical protein